ncbi:MAG: hypothetical protein DSY33_05490 [Archaeoglobus sp.]|nr:MAG: hypothetical protein DSY33_05490 [Archaeoglobus sp.]
MVVVAGINARNAVRSARISGYSVCAVAKYCDEDLKLYSDEYYRFGEINEAVNLVVRLCEEKNTFAVLTTGLEKLLREVKKKVEVAGNFNRKCLDKLKFYRELDRAGIVYPELEPDAGKLILKPRFGGGGVGTSFLGANLDVDDSDKSKYDKSKYIVQRYIEGETVSAIVLSNGRSAKCVALNRLLSGWKEMNARGFLYSGNVTPLENSRFGIDFSRVRRISEEVASLFDVEGCCGVDMVAGKNEIFTLELNPRIPGSLDSFELSYGVSLFDLHVKVFEGKLTPEKINLKPKRVACRAVYYSPGRVRAFISPHNPFFADIPSWGEVFEPFQPLVSIISTGKGSLNKVLERKKFLERLCLKVA